MKRSCCNTKWLALWSFALLTASVSANDLPAPRESFVNDFAELLSDDEAHTLRQRLQEIKQQRDLEITLVTQQRKSSGWENASIEQYAMALFNHWGVGNAEREDGVMLLILVQDREARIELGAGYGRRFDRPMQRVMDNELLPLFKQQRWAEAMALAIARFERISQQTLDNHDVESGSAETNDVWKVAGIALFGAGGLGGLALWFARHRRYRPRQCQLCHAPMIRLSEEIDDRHLNAGQRAEERIGSVDYDVWKCTGCEHAQVLSYNKWFSAIEKCPQCGQRTGKSVRAPYHAAAGGYYLNSTCLHCQHHWSRFVRHSQSNGSGGSGSFGGGISGGGGATGRW